MAAKNKEPAITRRFHILFFSLGLILLGFTVIFLWLKETHSFSPVQEWKENWQYISAGQPGWHPWHIWDSGERYRTVVIRNNLPRNLPRDAALFFPPYSIFQAFEVVIGKDMVYRSGRLSPCFSNRHLYLKWHLIPLSPGQGGKPVFLKIHSDHYAVTGMASPPYIGPRTGLFSSMVLADMDISFLAMLFILIGTIAAVAWIADHGSVHHRSLALLALLSVFSGIYFLTESRITQLYIGVSILISYLHYLSFIFFTAGMAAFIEVTVGPGFKSCIRRMWQMLLLSAAAGTALDLLSAVTWDITFDTVMWAVLLALLPISLELIKKAVKGSDAARVICMGFSVMLCFGLVDLLSGLKILSIQTQTVFPWGFMFLLFSFMWVVIYNYKIERDRNAEAVMEERHRIAREIHDGLAQDLAAMNIKTAVWKILVKTAPEKMEEELSWLQSRLSESIRDVRRCIFALRPADLETHGFQEGIQRLVRQFQTQHNLDIALRTTGLGQLPSRLELTLFRLVQEGLNNTIKHSGATQATVRLAVSKRKGAVLEISDNGKGFVQHSLDLCYKNGHVGLRQARERVEKVQGKFKVKSRPGKGTSLTAVLPLAPAPSPIEDKGERIAKDPDRHCR